MEWEGNGSNVTISTAIIYIQASCKFLILTLKVLVTTIDAQWEGMGDVGSARYELALLGLSSVYLAVTGTWWNNNKSCRKATELSRWDKT